MLSNKLHRTAWHCTLAIAVAVTACSCGTKKQVINGTGDGKINTGVSVAKPAAADAMRTACLEKVEKNNVGQQNLTSNIDFRIKTGSKDLSVDGKLYMRKDDVIRIQLSPLGMVEVGRIEFTKDSVLFMDRIHKQYVKGCYNDVGFLRDNGLDFYSLQSLFWNQVYVSGAKAKDAVTVTEPSKSVWKIQYAQGKMEYAWWADMASGIVRESSLTYRSTGHGTSQLQWSYEDFKDFGKGKFPASHTVKFKNNKKDIALYLTLKTMKNDSKWDNRTSVPSKYKPVSIDDVLTKITNL